MIPRELDAKILRMYRAEKWKVGTIARQLDVHHSTVRRVLTEAGEVDALKDARPSMVDPFLPFMLATLKDYPTLPASRLYEMVKERGYPGGQDHFRAMVARYRPRPPAEAYLRLRTLPGEQAQVDWGYFGRVTVGNASRWLMGFVMVLSWSRQIFLRFFLNQGTGNFLRGHQEAFSLFGGVPRVLLYDNLKSVVLERIGDAVRFNPAILEFAAHHGYEPRPVGVARGNEKGRAERAILYIRRSFIPARKWRDLDDLNAQALDWCRGISADRRCPEDRSMTVREALEQERPHLLPLPDNPFPVEDRVEVRVGKTPYVRFDSNDYSVPHDRVRRTLIVRATEDTVRILDDSEEVARHPRSWDKGHQVECPEHIRALVEHKAEARKHRGMDRLYNAVPVSRELLVSLAERGDNLGSATASFLRLLDRYGTQELTIAIDEALEAGTPHPNSVRHVLERRRREKGNPPPLSVELPDDPKIRGLTVRPHSLETYDALQEESSHDPKTKR